MTAEIHMNKKNPEIARSSDSVGGGLLRRGVIPGAQSRNSTNAVVSAAHE